MRLMQLLSHWPALHHFVRHECGFIVPLGKGVPCPNCVSHMMVESYEDIWVWT